MNFLVNGQLDDAGAKYFTLIIVALVIFIGVLYLIRRYMNKKK